MQWIWGLLKRFPKIYLSDLVLKFAAVVKIIDFISEVYDMFGFIGKFKQEVISGFELVRQRLVTLEAKVDALFAADKVRAEAEVAKVEAPVEAVAAPVEAVVEKVESDAKQE